MSWIESWWNPLPECHFYDLNGVPPSIEKQIAAVIGREIAWTHIALDKEPIAEEAITIIFVTRATRGTSQATLFLKQNEKSNGRFIGLVYDDHPGGHPFINAISESEWKEDRESLRYLEISRNGNVDGPKLIELIREVAARSGMPSNRGFLARMTSVALPLLGAATFTASVYATYVFSASLLVPALEVVALAICVYATWKFATGQSVGATRSTEEVVTLETEVARSTEEAEKEFLRNCRFYQRTRENEMWGHWYNEDAKSVIDFELAEFGIDSQFTQLADGTTVSPGDVAVLSTNLWGVDFSRKEALTLLQQVTAAKGKLVILAASPVDVGWDLFELMQKVRRNNPDLYQGELFVYQTPSHEPQPSLKELIIEASKVQQEE